MAHERHAGASSNVHYEVWYGGTDFRHVRRETLDDAIEEANEFIEEGQINVRILKVTHTKEFVEFTPSTPASKVQGDTPEVKRLTSPNKG